jgi:T5SS/PEP-CTERM-associated repeat protein/autotransporter-associated beta strand protein
MHTHIPHSRLPRFLTAAAASAAALAATAPFAAADFTYGDNDSPHEITGNATYSDSVIIDGENNPVVQVRDGGVLTITGSNSLLVGNTAKGTLEILAGGTVNITTPLQGIHVAATANSTGQVTVSGNGASLNADILSIGSFGNGALDIANGGTVTATTTAGVGGGSSATGTLNLRTGGTLVTPSFVFGADGGNAVLNLNGGTIRATAAGNFFIVMGGSHSITLNATGLTPGLAALTFDVPNAAHSVTIANVLTGDGGFAKTGAGTTVLSGKNTYTGATTVSGGTLKLSGNVDVSKSSGVTLEGSGKLDISAITETSAYVGSLNSTSASTEVVLGEKRLIVSLAPEATDNSTFAGVISGSGELYGGTAGSEQGKTLTLSGVNTYTGQTILQGWGVTLALTGSGSIANSSRLYMPMAPYMTFDISGTTSGATLKSLDSAISTSRVVLGEKTLTIAEAGTVSFAGTISGTGGLTKTNVGTLTLTGDNTYEGTTTVAGGILKITGELRGGQNPTGNIVLSNNGKIVFTKTGAQKFSGVLSGTGTIEFGSEKSVVIAGTGTLRPGSGLAGAPGALTFQNASNVSFENGATFAVFLAALTPSGNDFLLVEGGDLVLDGSKLEVLRGKGSPLWGAKGGSEIVIARVTDDGKITGMFANVDPEEMSVTDASGRKLYVSVRANGDGGQDLLLTMFPEPSTYALLGGTGVLLLALFRKRQRTRRRTGNAGL